MWNSRVKNEFFCKFPKFLLTFPYLHITICNMKTNLQINEVITTARLPVSTRNKLLALSRVKNKTKSDIIIESLEMYYQKEEDEIDSFTLGESFFGKYGSGESDRAVTYKQRIKEKLSQKMSSQGLGC